MKKMIRPISLLVLCFFPLVGCSDQNVRSIVSISLSGTTGNIDTYTIAYSDGSSSTFTVTNGETGKDGSTPYIGENGNWWINDADTGIKATVSDAGYYFSGNSVEELNQLSLKENCKKIIFDQNVELIVDQTIKIQEGQTIIGNGATIKRAESFKEKMILLNSDVEFSHFNIDGSNIVDGEWDTTIDLVCSSGCFVHDCEFYNSNEAIVAYGRNINIERNIINSSNGNGIHLSDCLNSVIKNNYVKNTNLSDSYTNGQAGIYICQDVYDVLIDSNYVENSKNGIGRLDSIKNQNITISNNNICHSREYGLYGIYHSDDENMTAKNLLIYGNIFNDCKYVAFKNNFDSSIISNLQLTFSNNILIDTSLILYSNKNSIISGNRIINGHIELNYANYITISDNYIEGDIYGIYGQRSKNINVVNNIIQSPGNGICFKTSSNTNTITGNVLTINVTELANTEGIYAGQNSTISFNTIYSNNGVGIICNDNSTIIANKIFGLENTIVAIKVYGGSLNIIVRDNNACNSIYSLSQNETCFYENNIITNE